MTFLIVAAEDGGELLRAAIPGNPFVNTKHSLARRSVALLLAIACAGGVRGQAAIFDFVNDTWDHSAFGGPASNAGWGNGFLGGTSIDSGSGLTATVSLVAFGTAVRVAPSLERQATTDTNETFVRGFVTTDFNSGATLDNYVVFRVQFSTAVAVGPIRIYDVDDTTGAAWQDFVSVRPYLNGVLQPVAYSVSNATNQRIRDASNPYLGQQGVMGINGVNQVTNTLADAFATVGSDITSYDIVFTQGPQGSSAIQHLIGLYPVIAQIPEPGATALAGVGLMLLWVRSRVRGQVRPHSAN
jgi:hypothetical protein